MHCKIKIKKDNNFVKVTKTVESESLNSRKYDQFKILDKRKTTIGLGFESINY